MKRYFKCQFVKNRVLHDRLHKKSRSAYIIMFCMSPSILVGSYQVQVTMHIDTSTEVMQITHHNRISPTGIILDTTPAIQVQYKQIRFRNGFYNRFTQAPRLHGPQCIRIKCLEQLMDSFTYRIQILGSINRRPSLMERISGINSMRTEQLLFFFHEITPESPEQ